MVLEKVRLRGGKRMRVLLLQKPFQRSFFFSFFVFGLGFVVCTVWRNERDPWKGELDKVGGSVYQ